MRRVTKRDIWDQAGKVEGLQDLLRDIGESEMTLSGVAVLADGEEGVYWVPEQRGTTSS